MQTQKPSEHDPTLGEKSLWMTTLRGQPHGHRFKRVTGGFMAGFFETDVGVRQTPIRR